jgi:hypothetical protein
MLETRLQMRLENGDPKCANCASWGRGEEVEFSGDRYGTPTVGICRMRANGKVVDALGHMSVAYLVVTTDLTVCSKWAQKD